MKLIAVQIENYKIIEDSEEFSVDQVTCLVGKNESGKTAILEALYKIKPVEENNASFQDLDYPRRQVSVYRDRADTSKQANVLTTRWQLEDEDIKAIEGQLGFNPLTSAQAEFKKGYSNNPVWDISIDYMSAVRRHIGESDLNEREKQELSSVETITDLFAKLTSIADRSGAQEQLLQQLTAKYPNGSLKSWVSGVLSSRLPTFIYFSDYYRMPGRAALNDILSRQQQNILSLPDKVFLAFLDLAHTSVQDISEIGTSEELIMELEAVSNRITDEIFEYWSQNAHLTVQFRCDQARGGDPAPYNSGYVFSTRIENQRHRVTVNFDERSTGFIWFFSFLVWFSQVRNNYGENLLILLDEPGLTLHGKAQADLLRYINERLRPNYQVIYTTHSPFMVDPEHILSARTVEDRTARDQRGRDIIEGTKVGDRVLSTDADTLLPLQGALGYEITQTLFVGAHTLIVEGPSDILYLKTVSAELEKLGRISLDPRWTIAPSGGLDKVMSFVSLFSGRNLHIAVLTDLQHGDKAKVRKLRESEILTAGHVITADDYVDQDEADIEDLLGRNAYVELVAATYNLSKKDSLPAKRPEAAPERCVKEVEEKFRLLLNTPEFDHFRPSQYFAENIASLRNTLPEWENALASFEKLFTDLNALL